MTRTLLVEPEAEKEIRTAARWYEERSTGLGARMALELDATLERVLEAPHVFPIVAELGMPNVRRALLRRFPYAAVFIESTDAVNVIAFAHGRRRPLYWAARVSAGR